MNTLKYLTKIQYENLKQNIDFCDEEKYIVEQYRKGHLTADAMARELNISEYEFKRFKRLAKLKILEQASLPKAM